MTVASIRILGIGNEFRNDDAIGIVVAKRLKSLNLPNIIVLEASGDAGVPVGLWSDASPTMIIDAVSSGAKPGTIIRIDTCKQSLPSDLFHFSTHSISIGDSIELAKILGTIPERCVFFGIEGKNFRPGTSVSPEVLDAGEKVVAMVCGEINSWTLSAAFADQPSSVLEKRLA